MQENMLEYQREQHIRTILEAIPDDLMLVDSAGNILEYKMGKSAYHLPMDLFLGTTLGELFAPDVVERLQAAIQSVLGHEPAQVIEIKLDGRNFEARVGAMERNVALILFRDVTAERETERLRSEFIAAVSHELKTPLASILGFSELLLDDNYGPGELREFLENIQYSSLRLKDMVNNLLDTSRLEAGRFSISPQPVDLQYTLAQTARSFAGVAKLSQIRFVCELDPLPIIEADPERIGQVVGNLLSNAFKFCPRQGTIWLRARSHGGCCSRSRTPAPASRWKSKTSSSAVTAAPGAPSRGGLQGRAWGSTSPRPSWRPTTVVSGWSHRRARGLSLALGYQCINIACRRSCVAGRGELSFWLSALSNVPRCRITQSGL